jgi:hypothetical protein
MLHKNRRPKENGENEKMSDYNQEVEKIRKYNQPILDEFQAWYEIEYGLVPQILQISSRKWAGRKRSGR